MVNGDEARHCGLELARAARDGGADLVGFAEVSQALPSSLRAYTHAISIGVKLLDSVLDGVACGPTMGYYHHYRTVNALLDQLALAAAKGLERAGWAALPVPASQTVDAKSHFAIFQHKTAANLAGLGWIGRSALLVNPRFGPRVRFSTVLTGAPLPTPHTPLANGCHACSRCVSMCPAGAFTGALWTEGADRALLFDAHRCSEYMRKHCASVGRGSVCGICVSVCPYGAR